MKQILKLFILIIISFNISACSNKTSISYEITSSDIKYKTCLITNNFYSDQCIENKNNIPTSIDYLNIKSEYKISYNQEIVFNYDVIYNTTLYIKDKDNNIIYNIVKENIINTYTKELNNNPLITLNYNLYIKNYIEELNKYLSNNKLNKDDYVLSIEFIIKYKPKYEELSELELGKSIIVINNDTLNIE